MPAGPQPRARRPVRGRLAGRRRRPAAHHPDIVTTTPSATGPRRRWRPIIMRNATTGLVDHASVLRVPLATPPPSVSTRRYRKISLGLALADAAAISLALLFSYWIRFDLGLLPSRELVLLGLAPLVWVLVFQAFSLYRPMELSPAEEFRRTVGATGVGVVLLVMVAFWSKRTFSRGWIGLTFVLAVLFELVVRRFWRLYQHHRKLDGSLALRTLIIGSTGEAIRLAAALRAPGSAFA